MENSATFDSPHRPELLAPAGDMDCARAAVENGADAVYFGLRSGLNARARAANFAPDELPELMAYLHRRGVLGYITLNTLVFPGELAALEQSARTAIAAGVDAVLVQDLGVARLLQALCPDWPVHASTQMSLTSAEGIRVAESLGIRRVVLARELSLEEIRRIRAETRVELEVFVHGALCISYSGQCMASLALGGQEQTGTEEETGSRRSEARVPVLRSGNRGQCAQPCRLPYELICDGRRLDLGGRKYLLSPLDLAALDLLPELIAAGVNAVKIEGRLKSADYVAAVTRHYRRAIDEVMAGRRPELTAQEIEDLEVAFSRGLSHGWLEGGEHQRLVPGVSSAKRGVCVGTIRGVRGGRVIVELASTVKRGDGVVFDGDRAVGDEQGGRVYGVFRGGQAVEGPADSGLIEISFARDAIEVDRLRPGQKLWKTDDPHLARRWRKTYAAGQPRRRVAVDLTVEAAPGVPLRITAQADSGAACRIASPQALQAAVKHPLTAELLREQFGRLGGSVYQLRHVDARIEGRPMVPLSVLGQLRHELVRQLDAAAAKPRPLAVAESSPVALLRPARGSEVDDGRDAGAAAQLHVLCRSLDQLRSVLTLGVSSVMVELPEINQHGEAVAMARACGSRVLLATPRIQKPDEMEVLGALIGYRPDGLLVRHLAGAALCREQNLLFVADFSLHAANELTVQYLHEFGASRVTAAGDLNREQLLELASLVPPGWLEVIVRQRMPMFHTEHCLFCAALSEGVDKSDCGRPCRQHDVRLRDRRGAEHLLRADACCRNTLYHAQPLDRIDLVSELRHRGVRHFRIELLDEPARELGGLLARYRSRSA
jgi:U32 family peptidase